MSVNNEHEMLEPEQELKNVGLKATAPRMRILELFQKAQESGAVRHLIENKKDRERMGQRACETILKEWNADTAAARCLSLYEGWEKGRMSFPESGPLSPAPMIRP